MRAFTFAACCIALLIGGCATQPPRTPSTPIPASVPADPPATRGGYYKDDGPGANPPADLASIPDAVPRTEPLHRFANRPYVALGRSYTPMTAPAAFSQRGLASWYGRRYHGQATSSGETYDMYAMSAAHPTLPIPSYARVTHVASGRTVVVRVNDRGPFHADRVIDLSYVAAWKLGFVNQGSAEVMVEAILPDARSSAAAATATPIAIPIATSIPVPPQPANVAAGSSASTGFHLQLGAFDRAANAEGFREQAQRTVGTLNENMSLVSDGQLYRVYLGPYGSAQLAREAAERIGPMLGVKPFVVHR